MVEWYKKGFEYGVNVMVKLFEEKVIKDEQL